MKTTKLLYTFLLSLHIICFSWLSNIFPFNFCISLCKHTIIFSSFTLDTVIVDFELNPNVIT